MINAKLVKFSVPRFGGLLYKYCIGNPTWLLSRALTAHITFRVCVCQNWYTLTLNMWCGIHGHWTGWWAWQHTEWLMCHTGLIFVTTNRFGGSGRAKMCCVHRKSIQTTQPTHSLFLVSCYNDKSHILIIFFFLRLFVESSGWPHTTQQSNARAFHVEATPFYYRVFSIHFPVEFLTSAHQVSHNSIVFFALYFHQRIFESFVDEMLLRLKNHIPNEKVQWIPFAPKDTHTHTHSWKQPFRS